ncbi:MAG: three-Cys-motif partner protein TcmP, partial [Actinobacteria bacterium]|nr:three-Cys-motif partner protein TcmP [Actinomycetota bacterium]
VFIDPFGFSGIKFEILKKIMQISHSEIIINFMYNSINRFLGHKCLSDTFTSLYGNNFWKDCIHKKGRDREYCIVSNFRLNLKSISKFVYYYRMSFEDKKRTYYYLIHLSNHHKGCSIMKSSFAKYNLGRVEYKGLTENQLEIFENPDVKIKNAIEYLNNKYKGSEVSFEEIVEDSIDETPFLESDLRNAIKNMEGIFLKVDRLLKNTKTGKSKKSIEYKDTIIFNDN